MFQFIIPEIFRDTSEFWMGAVAIALGLGLFLWLFGW